MSGLRDLLSGFLFFGDRRTRLICVCVWVKTGLVKLRNRSDLEFAKLNGGTYEKGLGVEGI